MKYWNLLFKSVGIAFGVCILGFLIFVHPGKKDVRVLPTPIDGHYYQVVQEYGKTADIAQIGSHSYPRFNNICIFGEGVSNGDIVQVFKSTQHISPYKGSAGQLMADNSQEMTITEYYFAKRVDYRPHPNHDVLPIGGKMSMWSKEGVELLRTLSRSSAPLAGHYSVTTTDFTAAVFVVVDENSKKSYHLCKIFSSLGDIDGGTERVYELRNEHHTKTLEEIHIRYGDYSLLVDGEPIINNESINPLF